MKFETLRKYTFCVIALERLAPAFLRVTCLALVFFALTWLGLFDNLTLYAHIIGIVAFITAFILAIYPLRNYKIPTQSEIIARLDETTGLKHRPLATLQDKPVGDNKESIALYDAYKARLVKNLTLPRPRFNFATHHHDPYAMRAIVALLFCSSLFLGRESINSAFDFDKTPAKIWRADMWVTPPDYTGLPSKIIFSDSHDQASLKTNHATLEVLKGSKLFVRGEGLPKFKAVENERLLTQSLEFKVTGVPKRGDLPFKLTVIDDRAPAITLLDKPKSDDKARLVLSYKIDDDFGASEANATFTLPANIREKLSRNPRPVFEMPLLPLALPPQGKGDATTSHDFGTHPFAGMGLMMSLSAKDALAQTGVTEAVLVDIPRRLFTKPLALALLEERQNIALDMNLRPKVLRSLEAMMIAPAVFTPESSVYLGLRTSYARLARARNIAQMQSVVDYLYEIALFIEEGYGSDAEKAYKALQEELKKAMERNAPADEIAQLMQKLREALAKMMAEISKNLKSQPKQEGGQPPSQQFSGQTMQDMLKQIEELMRQGAHEQARRLLEELQRQMAELEQAMKEGRLQMQEGGEGEPSELSDMIQKQQELRDKTFNENRNGKKSEEDLAGNQEALRKKLDDLKGKGEQNDSQKEGLEQAEREMGNARDALKKGDGKGAMEAQRKALQGLQKGAQKPEQAQGEGQGQGQPNGERGTDPLGRSTAKEKEGKDGEASAGAEGRSNAQNGISAGERAGKILDELRKRAGDATRSADERDYIDRLLKGLK
jgi:hypothetical protein